MRYAIVGMLLALLCIGAAGCRTGNRAAAPAGGVKTAPAHEGTPAATPSPNLITVTDATDKPVFSVTRGADRVEFTAQGAAAGYLKMENGTVSIFGADGKKQASVKREGEDYRLDDGDGKKLGKLSAKEGGFRLKDAAGKITLKIKPDGGNYKVSDGAEPAKPLAKGKPKGETTTLESPEGAVLYKLAGTQAKSLAAGVVITETLTLAQKAALIVAAGDLP